MLPFDTSDKKPKLYDLLILALAVGVFEGVLVARGDYQSTIISAVVAIVFTPLLKGRINRALAFSTTNYHVFRSGLYARRVKMRAVGMGAKTKWYFWPNAAVREFVGILTEHRAKQALILGSLVLAYMLLTIAVYR